MSCYKPMKAYQLEDGSITWREQKGRPVRREFDVACGQCIGCRIDRARDLTVRMVHESYAHEQSMCATFTYADEHLGPMKSVSKRDSQLFLKRLREVVRRRDAVRRLRYCWVAEYSPGLMRPHYHAVVYGYWPEDTEGWSKSRAGNPQFVSDELTQVWGKGHVTFQAFTPQAASYCAKYVTKKLGGELEQSFLQGRESEFMLWSRRPGLGASFYAKYGEQIRELDFVVIDGKKQPVPKYYDRLTERFDPALLGELKAQRELKARAQWREAWPDRLRVREECTLARANLSRRDGMDV